MSESAFQIQNGVSEGREYWQTLTFFFVFFSLWTLELFLTCRLFVFQKSVQLNHVSNKLEFFSWQNASKSFSAVLLHAFYSDIFFECTEYTRCKKNKRLLHTISKCEIPFHHLFAFLQFWIPLPKRPKELFRSRENPLKILESSSAKEHDIEHLHFSSFETQETIVKKIRHNRKIREM